MRKPSEIKIGDKTLTEIMKDHVLWIQDEGGARANLARANLYGANLVGAMGNGKEIKTIHIGRWPVTYTSKVMQIGCQRHEIEKWRRFSDAAIRRMDSEALEFWKQNKSLIFSVVDGSPAVPIVREDEAVS